MKLVITYSTFRTKTLYFDNFEEFTQTEKILLSINKGGERNVAILVNPISGKRKGRQSVRNTLIPMLMCAGLSYETFETDSSTYIDSWVEQFNDRAFPYTDIV